MIRSRPNRQKGLISIAFALLLPGLFVALALAWDTGYLMVLKGRAQHIANAAALSGAKSLFIQNKSCNEAGSDAEQLIQDNVSMQHRCDGAFFTEIEIIYRPILLGAIGMDSGNLTASARAGTIENAPGHSPKRIALLDKET